MTKTMINNIEWKHDDNDIDCVDDEGDNDESKDYDDRAYTGDI